MKKLGFRETKIFPKSQSKGVMELGFESRDWACRVSVLSPLPEPLGGPFVFSFKLQPRWSQAMRPT